MPAPWIGRLLRYWPATRYLLRDEFTTARAAGLVGGMPAEPGPGIHTVTDTESKLSIANGALTFAGGRASPGWGDPRTFYTTIRRVPGQVMLLSLNYSTVGNSSIGLAASSSGAGLIPNGFYPQSTTSLQNGSGVAVAGGLAAATTYTFVICLRATGYFLFIRGGVYAQWTLLWFGGTDSSANLFPILTNYNATFTADSIHIPTKLWLPTPLVSDAFTGMRTGLGSSDGVGHAEANGGWGVAWVRQIGTTALSGAAAICMALDGGIAIATANAGTVNVLHSAKLTRGTGTAGVVVRYKDSSNYVYAIHNGTNVQLIKRVANVETTLINVVATYAAGATLLVIADATKFRLYYNNVFIGTEQTIADADLQTGTAHGLYYTDTDSTLDDCVAWARGDEGQYAILDSM